MRAQVHRVALRQSALDALTADELYVFALAGHVFNELVLLQKWLHLSRVPPQAPNPEKDAGVGVSLFLLRLLAGKTYEALGPDALGKPSVKAVLKSRFFCDPLALAEAWEGAITQFQSIDWLARVRNRSAFHYRTRGQLAPVWSDGLTQEAYIYVGQRYADTHFFWAEMAFAYASMTDADSEAPLDGLDQMLAELGDLLGVVTDCLARGVQLFMLSADLVASTDAPVTFDAPDFDTSQLRYFYANPNL